jgi:hypothetical protein
VDIPDFITSGESVVPNETNLEPNVSLSTKDKPAATSKTADKPEDTAAKKAASSVAEPQQSTTAPKVTGKPEENKGTSEGTGTTKKVKKIVKKRNPVLHTPQTAQETVAKTLEAAAATKSDMTVYKANGEQARDVSQMEGRVKRGPRVGRGMVEEPATTDGTMEVTEQSFESATQAPTKSVGVVDDFSMEEKF